MAKTATNCAQFRDPFQPDFGPDRHICVVATDDGSIYEFQRLEDAPYWNLRARGSRDSPRHQWTDSKAQLPSDVTETLDETLGVDGWQK